MKNLKSLKFINDGKLLEFLSEDNEVILVASSKQQALKALADMACNKSISFEEFKSFQKTIIEIEELPWLDDSKKSISTDQKLADTIIGDEIFNLLTSLEQLGMIGLLVNPFQTSPFYPSSFLPCNYIGQRGVIWTEVGFSTIISSKEVAYNLLNALRKIGEIDESEIAEIKKQVDRFYKQSH